MSASSLHSMKEWAKYVDRGTRELEDFVRSGFILNENDANDARSVLKVLTAEIKSKKAELRTTISRLRSNAEEMKQMLEVTCTEKNRISESLREMASILQPGEPLTDESSVLSVSDLASGIDTVNLEEETLEVLDSSEPSYITLDSTADESYVVVEVTPGLKSKVPKSRLVGQKDFLPATVEKARNPFGLFGSRSTLQLTYSPDTERKDTTPRNVLLPRCNNIETESPARLAEPERSSNCILKRPEMPILSQYAQELLAGKFLESVRDANTPAV